MINDITFTHLKKTAIVTICYRNGEAIKNMATLIEDDLQFDKTANIHEKVIRMNFEDENK